MTDVQFVFVYYIYVECNTFETFFFCHGIKFFVYIKVWLGSWDVKCSILKLYTTYTHFDKLYTQIITSFRSQIYSLNTKGTDLYLCVPRRLQIVRRKLTQSLDSLSQVWRFVYTIRFSYEGKNSIRLSTLNLTLQFTVSIWIFSSIQN